MGCASGCGVVDDPDSPPSEFSEPSPPTSPVKLISAQSPSARPRSSAHVFQLRMPLANPLQLRVELLIRQLRARLLHLHVLIAVDGELRQHFKHGLERERLAFVQLQIGDLGLRYRPQALLRNRLAKVLGHQRLHHVLAQRACEARPQHALRNLARTEARNPRQLLILLQHRAEGLADLIGRRFHLHLARALRIQCRLLRKRVGFVLWSGFVFMSFMSVFRGFRFRSSGGVQLSRLCCQGVPSGAAFPTRLCQCARCAGREGSGEVSRSMRPAAVGVRGKSR